LVLARDNGWICLSNDGPLREACKAQDVPVVWGLEIMLSLVEGKYLTPAAAIQAAQAIHAVNPMFITAKVLAYSSDVDQSIQQRDQLVQSL
jgi:hypothetical protein